MAPFRAVLAVICAARAAAVNFVSPLPDVSYVCAQLLAASLPDGIREDIHETCASCDTPACAKSCLKDVYRDVASQIQGTDKAEYETCLEVIPSSIPAGCWNGLFGILSRNARDKDECADPSADPRCHMRRYVRILSNLTHTEKAWLHQCSTTFAAGVSSGCAGHLAHYLDFYYHDPADNPELVFPLLYLFTSEGTIDPLAKSVQNCQATFQEASPHCMWVAANLLSTSPYDGCFDALCKMTNLVNAVKQWNATEAGYYDKCLAVFPAGIRNDECSAFVLHDMTAAQQQTLQGCWAADDARCVVDMTAEAIIAAGPQSRALYDQCQDVMTGPVVKGCYKILRELAMGTDETETRKGEKGCDSSNKVPALDTVCRTNTYIMVIGAHWDTIGADVVADALDHCRAGYEFNLMPQDV